MTTIRGTRPPPDSSATAQTTVVDCAYATCKSGKVVEFGMRDWRRRLMGMRKKSDGHEKEF